MTTAPLAGCLRPVRSGEALLPCHMASQPCADVGRAAMLLAAVVAGHLGPALAADIVGRAEVIDGNTVRLFGIDAPDREQSCGDPGEIYFCGVEAMQALRAMIAGREIRCVGHGRDADGRMLAVCYAGAADINGTLVRAGKAVADRRQGRGYLVAESAAKRERRGLWSGAFQVPEEWRREHRR